jgi:hypothetical protein
MNHPVSYQIRIRSRLGRTIRAAFPTLRAEEQDEDTLLAGVLADQAALHGVLTQIEALGLELVEVRRLPGEASAAANHPAV